MIDFKNGVVYKLKKDAACKDKAVAALLVPEEKVLSSYTAMRDYVGFTDKRIISVNGQGLTGKKKDYTSLPYSKIQAYSVETAGVFDLDSELELWFSGMGRVKLEFIGATDVAHLCKMISQRVL